MLLHELYDCVETLAQESHTWLRSLRCTAATCLVRSLFWLKALPDVLGLQVKVWMPRASPAAQPSPSMMPSLCQRSVSMRDSWMGQTHSVTA